MFPTDRTHVGFQASSLPYLRRLQVWVYPLVILGSGMRLLQVIAAAVAIPFFKKPRGLTVLSYHLRMMRLSQPCSVGVLSDSPMQSV